SLVFPAWALRESATLPSLYGKQSAKMPNTNIPINKMHTAKVLPSFQALKSSTNDKSEPSTSTTPARLVEERRKIQARIPNTIHTNDARLRFQKAGSTILSAKLSGLPSLRIALVSTSQRK